jgi:6-phosphogluconolactonase
VNNSPIIPSISATIDELVAQCGRYIQQKLNLAIGQRGVSRMALAGGSTPKALYAWLASPAQALQVDWSRVQFYFGDERSVPRSDPDSNYGMAKTYLFDLLGINQDQIFPMISEPMLDIVEEAARYEIILDSLSGQPSGKAPPVFDLALNGMGADGHFASLFPNTPALMENEHWVVANPVEKLATQRITLTYPVFEQARAVCFLVAGADKQDAFFAVQQPDSELPVARLIRKRQTDWFVDQACIEGI